MALNVFTVENEILRKNLAALEILCYAVVAKGDTRVNEKPVENLVAMATILKTMKKSKHRYYNLNLSPWIFRYLEADPMEPQYLIFYVRQDDKEIRLRLATVEERMAGHQLNLYMSGLWPIELSEEDKQIFLENEEMHRLSPPRTYDGKILDFPFSKLSEKEYETYIMLPDDTEFTSKDLDMCISSRVTFIKKILELGMAEEVSPKHTKGRGRPLKQYKKRNDFDREVPWELVHAAYKHQW